MRARLSSPLVARSLWLLVSVLLFVGYWKGLRNGGSDFRVFYFAGKLVQGPYAEMLYREGPDRFLYAPGFAYLIAPLTAVAYPIAHSLWLFLSVCVFTASLRFLAKWIDSDRDSRDRIGEVAVGIGALFLMRPVWIDLRYGQVNLLILGAAIWALGTVAMAERRSPNHSMKDSVKLAVSWFLFSLAAFAKIYPLPLFLVPILALLDPRKRKATLPVFVGSIAGVLLLFALPALYSGMETRSIYSEWLHALVSKGLPLETHNQSLLAFLERIFSGEVIRSHQTGGAPMSLGPRMLSPEGIQTVFGATTLAIGFFFFRSALRLSRVGDALSAALCIALCFLPAHLIWKPYFLLGIPLAATLFARLAQIPSRIGRAGLGLYLALFLCAHLSSAEVIGHGAAAWFEAFSGFYWIHAALIVFALAISSSDPASSSLRGPSRSAES